MREMIADILASEVPVLGYVAPSGAHAASAGTYLLYAAHVAAMAPGTNLGAATPVQIGGASGLPGGGGKPSKDDGAKPDETAKPESPEAPMARKADNDAAAFIRSLAEMRGRNAEWAERAVREAASLSAKGALESGVIDLTARDIPRLLEAADGRETEVAGAPATLETAGARVETFEPSFMTKALGILANPNVAFVLLTIGVYGLIFEFASPGAIGPGIVGVICLVLAFYALNQLPLDYAGLGLVAFGIALMTVEAFSPAFGVFGIGGLVAMTLGAAMLIDTEQPAYQIDWPVIAGVVAV
ncbi:MAG: nodulation protein NfeD, partial [Alphaproteobacteria bacterium]